MLAVIVVAGALFIGAFAQGVAGAGLGLVSGGIMVIVLGRESGILLLTFLSIPMMLAVAWQNRAGILWKRALLIGGTGLLATPFLAVGLRHLNQAALLVTCGVLMLISVALLYFGLSAPRLATGPGAVGVGAMIATLNLLSGAGSPPATLYAVNSQWDAKTTRGTLQIVFLLLSIGTAFSLQAPSWDPLLVISAAAATAVGTVGGMLMAGKVSQDVARLVMLALAALGGITVLISGAQQLTG